MSRTCVSAEKHPYLVPSKYKEIASDRLFLDRGLLSKSYREYLEHQIEVCDKELLKKNRSNSIIWANKNHG